MNPWLLACLAACFVGAWAPMVHTQGAFEDCCLAYHHITRWNVLQHARSYKLQEVSGSCNLPAVIFFFPRRHKMICGNPRAKWVKIGMKRLDARSKDSQSVSKGSWKPFQGL
ncbi:C-C motif chemokine 25 [Dasypus novemcinctus]|uniref:C-C motif chemokine 25 n=1 Tax=Dasypus novemcinctus TaxID=9361 RepID=UPI00265FB270|nr:C-C motif chemokine 25 [Dasypus novemcinctus]